MNIVMFGPPGAGKGTQASLLSKKYCIAAISTGDMLRAAVTSGSDLGKEADAIMKRGELVPDEVMVGLIHDRIQKTDCANGFILDGFPRTLAQAQALDSMLAKEGKSLDHVIELQVDDQKLTDRITGRFTCANAQCNEGYHDHAKPTKKQGVCDVCGGVEFKRRADDNPETVKNRLTAYHGQTEPLLPYYEAQGILEKVDGMVDIAEVTAQIDKVMEPTRKIAEKG